MPANLKTAVTLRKAVRELVAAERDEALATVDLPQHSELRKVWNRADKARASYERALRKVFDDL